MQTREAVKTTNMFTLLAKSSSVDSDRININTTSDTPTSTTNVKKKNKSKKKKTTMKSSTLEKKTLFEEEIDPAELPLIRRLEVAASISDTHAALVGLLGWSRIYIHTETILTFFQSNALFLLLRNLLHSRPTAVVFDNLESLLANCLSLESKAELTEVAEVAPHRQMAGEVVAADLEAKIVQVTNEDTAVRGHTIRDSFRRRDLRSDALSLHQERHVKLAKLVEECVRRSEQQREVNIDMENMEKPLEETQTAEDESVMRLVTESLQDIQNRKDAELVPLCERKTKVETQVQVLRQKQEELEAQLLVIKADLQRAVGEQDQIEGDMRAVEERFITDTARIRAEHQDIMQRFSKAHRRRIFTTEVTKVANEVRQARLAYSQVHALRAKLTACVLQQLEGSLNYFESELPCIKFMMSRVNENEAKLVSTLDEIASYRALGVTAVALELEKQMSEIESHLKEDRDCLSALHKRDNDLLDSMHCLLTDPTLQDALVAVDAKVKHESQRMIDYVRKLYEDRSNSKLVSMSNGSQK
ncbi:uncharacterized protein PHALS_00115 [Plasmopara halstedii]|uniref:Uncharacterized protein n=1 Tax=Plasmopara halstedii TaxID=4781 RepID=A0A0P1A5H4_PLAHL|nr:uncharacterized protein PHALS_00115 [Plasmopara halstedii]CEG35784.1 hypothetical protein PHALS_00115 [Plasmopara halstedii]|eukprot:XP_024572153.1 hypothetical protein PHALS_00115 [Plasmopara halstedii]